MCDEPSITAAELADRLEGKLEGDPARVIHTIATLEEAGPDALSWIGSPEVLPRARRSQAGVLLVPLSCAMPTERTVIRVADPDEALCVSLECLGPLPKDVPPGIDPSATVRPGAVVDGVSIGANVYVGAGARIGAGTQLHPGVYVGARSNIGRDCVLWPHVIVRERVSIGDRVIIHPNATIGADGFSYIQREGRHRKVPQIGTVVISDDVEIGAGSTIDRARSGVTRIGRGTKIDNLVQIAHNCQIGEDCIITALCGIAGSTSLGHHVVMGGQVGVIDHLRIGSHVRIAAKSAVMRNIPDGQVVRGIPATDNHRFLREQASLRRLPEWMQKLRALTKRVSRLERRPPTP